MERSIKSGIWVSLINVFDRFIHVGRLVVLAAVLSPKDFGLLGIGLLVLAVLQQFSNLGIDEALIQKEASDVDRYLDTVFALNLTRGVAITAVLFSLAPLAAQFFSEPRATDVIRALTLLPLLRGLRNPGVVYLQKDLEFHKQFILKLSGTSVDFIVAVGYALIYQTVWALVFGMIAGTVVSTLISYPIHQYRPSLSVSSDFAKELLGYGKWLTASSGALFVNNQGDDAFVGWFLGATALGYYQLGYRISNAPATEVSQVIGSVLFPAYSKFQSDIDILREIFFRVFNLVSITVFPMAAGMVIVAQPFVSIVWGAEWEPMIPIIQLLAIFGLVRALGSASGPLFKAVGRPDLLTKTAVIDLVVIAIFIYPATARWGLVGTALVMVLRPVASGAVIFYLALDIIEADWRRLVRVVAYPLVASLLMAGVVLYVRLQWPGESAIELVSLISLGVVTYSGMILLFERTVDIGLRETANVFRKNI